MRSDACELFEKSKTRPRGMDKVSRRIPGDRRCEILIFSNKEAICLPLVLINELKNIKDFCLRKLLWKLQTTIVNYTNLLLNEIR